MGRVVVLEEPCQHPNKHATGARYSAVDGEVWYRCPDCKTKWSEPWKPREDKPQCPPACAEGHTYSGSCLHRADGPEEPPLTPEEEEQAPPDEHDWHHATPSAGLTCTRCGLAHKNWDGSECPAMQAEEEQLPPQPERRPPLAVAYSVGGHLYEVAVSGDATVRAVDGALVITHGLGSVAGIVQTAPLPTGERG
ncbi:hypothetical protein AB0P05_26645 [Streptomyces flaveolus]|uniref:hypothetical protein n=1 Tax=Streptomyces flaveolus TaxID=67297 RepID=UPI0034396CCC